MLVSDDTREKVMNNINSGYEKMYEAQGVRKNGEEYPLRLEGRNIPYRGRVVRVEEFRDISQQKKAEQEKIELQNQLIQAQKMESIGRLAGGIAHDFNNMLGVIVGHADMILDNTDPAEPLYVNLQEIITAGERSAKLTQQLLAFARKQAVIPVVLDLNEAVGSMIQMLKRLIGEHIDLCWTPGKEVWPIKVDPVLVDQILANLCVNSRDAITGVGRISIGTKNTILDDEFCTLHPGCMSGEYASLTVSDNGSGMDSETQSHIFEPFFTTKSETKGTGLGLAMVYGNVKQSNGYIDIYSEPEKGTTCRIYFPRHAAEISTKQKNNLKNTAEGGLETILVVEDQLLNLNMVSKMLEKLGYNVLSASRPNDAVQLIKNHPGEIHLLLTDVIMPEMNGLELSNKVLSLCPYIKKLFMSGYTDSIISNTARTADGLHFLKKPFLLNDLAAAIRDALDD